ncbi:GMC family oxidoreductase [Saccharothrix algeriensis]|uniref:Choline dehydrogenase n=1 Tax=Saccharothrix algeriensis TaxID=173560 RepID=A0A8T8HVT1_9PSEU|nr:GMC family oxidoreductase N-terminal domain-containing protein [Saccharothrix algeriensis]MBM7814323.1 choline dehydrogenase [Saccharothrix algeriensis]QTR02658.1 GMC family oxidoreductase N-terminal domain-containing protein [Saccharothrix algeriensis]
MVDADFVVVGGGTAGCVLARRLLDLTEGTVLLLEAGERDTNPAIHDPARMHELWDSAQDWGLRTVPQRDAANRPLHLPRGRVLGGSHALNAMIHVRGNPADYDGWAAAGNAGWSWADVEPVFRRIESGPLTILRDTALDPVQEAILASAQQAGVPFNPDYNGADQTGVSRMQFTIADGRRHTTARAYLAPVLDHPRFTLVTNAHVRRLLMSGDRCTGVEWTEYDRVRRARAGEVVLGAGAIGSPQVLLRSGIGPADELRALGVDVVADLPGVGENLQDHWLVPTVFSAAKPITHAPGLPPAQTHLFWRSRPGLPTPDLQPLHFSAPLYEKWMSGPDNGFSLMAGLIRPRSTGRLTLSSPDGPPVIDPRVLSEPADLDALVEAVLLCQEIGHERALEEWGADELYPGKLELRDYVRRSVVTYHHQAGTCAMGSVVDAELRVRGVAGLRVADASVMPTVVSGNTNTPTVMIAEKAAELMAG